MDPPRTHFCHAGQGLDYNGNDSDCWESGTWWWGLWVPQDWGTGVSEAQTAWFGSKSSQRDVEFSLAFSALCDFYGPSSGHIILGEQQGGNDEGTGSQEAPGE